VDLGLFNLILISKPKVSGGITPPAETFRVLAENNDSILTEDGSHLRRED
jgi:hypothetical protein